MWDPRPPPAVLAHTSTGIRWCVQVAAAPRLQRSAVYDRFTKWPGFLLSCLAKKLAAPLRGMLTAYKFVFFLANDV